MKRYAVSLICAAGLCAGAGAWQAQNDFAFGGGSYIADTLSLSTNISTSSIATVDLGFFKQGTYPDAVYNVKTSYIYLTGEGFYSIRPFFSPSTNLVDCYNAGIYSQYMFLLLRQRNVDMWHNLGFTVSLAMQRALLSGSSGESSREDIGEGALTVQYQQNFYNEFFLYYSLSGFKYSKSVKDSSVILTSLDQSEMAALGCIGPILELPSWSGGVAFIRTAGEESNGQFNLGYQYLAFANQIEARHSLSAGLKLFVGENSTFDLGYNWIAAGDYGPNNFYKITLRTSF